jgi:hypothetical protein
MERTRASEATSSSAARQRRRPAPLHYAQDPESEPEIAMDVDTESDDTAEGRPVSIEPVREGSTTTDRDDDDLVYDHTCFRWDKVRRQYTRYYHGCRIIIERGAAIKEFDERAPRVRVVLDAQGWTSMAEDHRPAVEAVVWEFYANIHQRCGDSFRTWLRGRAIEVTHTLISEITGVPRVRDPIYPYSIDHLPARADLVACFAKGRPHQMELEGEGSFQMRDFSNEVRCIYHILASRVLLVISHTMITIERRSDSFRTWLKGRAIEVTPTLISEITEVPHVRDPVYPYPIDHLPTRADLVACFAEGCPHQMELEGEGSFQMRDFSNDVCCIYHILASRVLLVISHTMITIKRSRCVYTMLTEALIDYGSMVTTTMMSVQLLDKGFALPYGALITRIAEHAGVDTIGLREIQP